ncbi:MAG: TraC family protein [Candidatus Promineifilaceae bacterium]
MIALIDKLMETLKLSRGDGIRVKDVEASLVRNRFSDHLPFRAYDPEDKFYLNADDSYGFLWETTPLVYGCKTSYDMLEQILKTVPMGTVLQVILYADSFIDPIIDEYLRLRNGDGVMSKKTAELFKKAGQEGFANIGHIPARRFRCFFALKLHLQDGFGDDARFLRDSVFEVLKGCGLTPRYLAPQGLCEWLQRLFNDGCDVPGPGAWHYNDEIPIQRQIIMGGSRTRVGFSHIELGEEKLLGIQTIKEYPHEALNDLTMNKTIGGLWGPQDDANQCHFPFMISVNIVVENLKHIFHGKTNMMMFQQKKGSGAGHKLDKQEELAWAAREVDRGERFVRVIPTILSISTDSRKASENTARIKRLWENQGFAVNNDRGILGPLFILSLPFGLYRTKNNLEFLQRDRIMPTASAARLLPIQGDFFGFGRPVSFLVGRKGQIVPIDLFNPDAPNHNALVTATTGSGKSYLMNRILSDLLSTGTIIRVFDLGRSYEKLTQIVKGNFIHFGKNSQVCVNPFSTVRDIDEEIGTLSLIVSQMVWSSSKDKPTETQMSVIKAAVRRVWDDYGTDGDIDYTKAALLGLDGSGKIKEIAEELAFNLSDFTTRGPYGRWFNGKASLDIERDRFVVLELEELIARTELFNVVILQIVNYVTQNLYLSDRSNPRTIVFDEAWKWFKEGTFLGEVVENGYRLARKYYGSFITVFQSLLDLKKFGKSGQVLNENSAYKFFLMANYDKAKEEKLIDLDPFMMQIINSVQLVKGNYSEVFVQTPLNMGVARLPSDPFTHMVFTSDPRENALIDKIAAAKGVSRLDAIEQMAENAA